MKFDFKKNKKIIIIVAASVLILIGIILIIILLPKKNIPTNNISSSTPKIFKPDILSSEEKTKLNIPLDAKIQAMVRDSSGTVKIYKIIKSDADIIDPDKVTPISPRVSN